MNEITISNLYDLSHTAACDFLKEHAYPWQALRDISGWIYSIGQTLDPSEYDAVKDGVWVHKTATVYDSAFLGAPCIIGAYSEVRHCAFIRGAALVGKNCVVGNSVELKNVILFDCVQVPHFNYVGDSILGYHSHMGAGSVTSNIKADQTPIVIKGDGYQIETGLIKIGAMLGDFVEIGCNTVLNPGTVVGKNTNVYPANSVRGVIAPNSIYKSADSTVLKH